MATDQPFSRNNLVAIGEELGKDDVKGLKFLCKDVLPKRSTQKMDRATYIFNCLVEKGKLKPNDGDFLLQCLYYMKKTNLIKKFGYRWEDVEKDIKDKNYKVTPFRALLFEISEDLDSDEVATLKYSMQEKYFMKKNQMERMNSGLDIMETLEADGRIDETDVKDLEDLILRVLGRDDLKRHFDEYLGVTNSGPQPMETEQTHTTQNVPQTHQNVPQTYQHVPQTNQQVPQTHQNVPQTNQQVPQTHEFLTSSSSQAPSVPVGHRNVEVSRHGARIHPVPLESRGTSEDAPDTIMTQDVVPRYKMTANPRGYCIIINNEKFLDETKHRKGSDKDAERLKNTFKHRKFIVKQFNDLRAYEITSKLTEFSKLDHNVYDALVVCILSHGDKETVQGIDLIHVQIGTLTALFKSSACKSLEGKPKLFFIQACQGKEKNKVTIPVGMQQDFVETDANRGAGQISAPLIPGEPDFLLGFASVPGYVSYRRKSRGTVYIEKLTSAIDRLADRCDLSAILLQVNSDVSEEKLDYPVGTQGTDAGQQPTQINRFIACSAPLNALRRLLYL